LWLDCFHGLLLSIPSIDSCSTCTQTRLCGTIFIFFAHGIHHLTPNDSTRLTFPPTFSGVIALVIAQIPGTVIPIWTGIHSAFAGVATGFVLYDTAHYYFHHGEATWLPMFLQKMKSTHLDHHYKNDNANYGVTSPLFDWVFGTLSNQLPATSKIE